SQPCVDILEKMRGSLLGKCVRASVRGEPGGKKESSVSSERVDQKLAVVARSRRRVQQLVDVRSGFDEDGPCALHGARLHGSERQEVTIVSSVHDFQLTKRRHLAFQLAVPPPHVVQAT